MAGSVIEMTKVVDTFTRMEIEALIELCNEKINKYNSYEFLEKKEYYGKIKRKLMDKINKIWGK